MANNFFKKGLLILMGLCTIMSLFGCGGNKDVTSAEGGKKITALEFTFGGYVPGYNYRIENGKLEYNDLGDESAHVKCKVDDDTLSAILDLIEKMDIYSWDQYHEYAEDVLDGENFSLYVAFSDNTSIKAQGENRFPEGYDEFRRELNKIFEPLITK